MHIEDNSYPSPHDNSQRKKTLKKLIEEAIKDEILDSEYFSLLSDVISDSQDKHTILNIRMDEEKHQNLLGGLYSMLTGNNPPEYTPEPLPTKAWKAGKNNLCQCTLQLQQQRDVRTEPVPDPDPGCRNIDMV